MSDSQYWNQVFERVRRMGSSMNTSMNTSMETLMETSMKTSMGEEPHWLASYLPLWRGQGVHRVLEIGCGSGMDTAFLAAHGFDVTATDFSIHALSLVREKLPDVSLLLHDTREPFPYPDESFDLILASLSLHYFPIDVTEQIVQEIKRLLRPRGLLLYRMNATSDEMAGVGERLGEDFYLQDGIQRRYFHLESCRTLFHGFEEILLEEKKVEPYGKVKALCEGLVRKKLEQ